MLGSIRSKDNLRVALVFAAGVLCLGIGVFYYGPGLEYVWGAQESPRALLAKGEYAEAIAQSEDALADSPQQADAMDVLLTALLETGEYRKVVERGEASLKQRQDANIAVKTAEALARLGEYDRATATLASFSTPQALWMRGTLAQRQGGRAEARDLFSQGAALLDPTVSSGPTVNVMDLAAIADSMAELARYQDANGVYQSASTLAPEDAPLKARWGRLFAIKHNPGEAEGLYREAIQINPKLPAALMGLAELAAGNWDGKAGALVEQALEVNPNLAEARLLHARVLMEQENYTEAAKQLDAVEELNPRQIEAWTLRGISEWLQGNSAALEQKWAPQILAANPAYGELYEALGNFAVIRRLYRPAVEFYQQALEKNPDLDDARSSLGINLFRLGEEAKARQVLEEAYSRDRFNIWTVNSLRLMDSLDKFDAFETDKFRAKLSPKESALLWPYVEEILETSVTSLTSRYGYKPDVKVLFEMFPDHEDFAVRTLGLPGLGALGASFGPVVAMDSPAARPTGQFHWGSTLWHELAHVITLGITDNKVPRWFTEGLSVYEEAHSLPGWGDPMDLGLIQALQRYGLVPIEKLDGVFVRPQYPNQVVFAYFQAGMICEFIIEKYGFQKILAMLKAYGEGKDDAEAFQTALGLSLTEFDKAFTEYAKAKTYNFGEAIRFSAAHIAGFETLGGPEEGPEEGNDEHGEGESGSGAVVIEGDRFAAGGDDFLSLLRQAAELKERAQPEEAIAKAEQAKRLFPPYVSEGNPYELLAEIYEQQNQKEKAVAELDAWRLQRGRTPETFRKLAEMQEQLGRRKEAMQTLKEVLQVSMYEIAIHEQLGAWALEEGDLKQAVREYRAVLALNPPDRAEAHFRLATALAKQSENAAARREVLAALEIAPGYRPAQQLLLELTRQ